MEFFISSIIVIALCIIALVVWAVLAFLPPLLDDKEGVEPEEKLPE